MTIFRRAVGSCTFAWSTWIIALSSVSLNCSAFSVESSVMACSAAPGVP
jgi:hypothetical protein